MKTLDIHIHELHELETRKITDFMRVLVSVNSLCGMLFGVVLIKDEGLHHL